MGKYIITELKTDEVWVFNSKAGKLPNREGKLKTMRFGKQALDINGDKLNPKHMLPVFIHKSEYNLMNKLWGEVMEAIAMRYR